MSLLCLSLLLEVISRNPHVFSVSLQLNKHIMNDKVRQFVQVGDSSTAMAYHSVGLNGSNVIVGIADTGVDEKSCYFSNPDNSFVKRSNISKLVVDFTKRKVVQYVSFADSGDVVAGHGTHTSGTLAGFSEDNSGIHYGVAPEAKLAFYDVGSGNSDYLSIPPLDTYVFPAAVFAEANLHSNSWGGDINTYDTSCSESDSYLHANSNFLAFYAAGNSGPGASTITSPGFILVYFYL